MIEVATLSFWELGVFRRGLFYEKHGYQAFSTIKDWPKGHTDYSLFKLVDKNDPKRPQKPIEFQILDGNEEDEDYICEQLDEGYNKQHLDLKHGYIKINRKLVNEKGETIAAIMAGTNEFDVDRTWKTWVDKKYRPSRIRDLIDQTL